MTKFNTTLSAVQAFAFGSISPDGSVRVTINLVTPAMTPDGQPRSLSSYPHNIPAAVVKQQKLLDAPISDAEMSLQLGLHDLVTLRGLIWLYSAKLMEIGELIPEHLRPDLTAPADATAAAPAA